MSIIRINYFQSKEGKEKEVLKLLEGVKIYIQNSEGNISCDLLQNQKDIKIFTVIEEWETEQAHGESLQNYPQEEMSSAMDLFEEPPSAENYTRI